MFNKHSESPKKKFHGINEDTFYLGWFVRRYGEQVRNFKKTISGAVNKVRNTDWKEVARENDFTGNEINSFKADKLRKIQNYVLYIITLLLLFSMVYAHIGYSIIQGNSMSPTYNDKDFALYTKDNLETISKGDVVIVETTEKMNCTGKYIIKRIVAESGDLVEIKNGKLYINGELQKEDYALEEQIKSGDYSLTVGEDEYFIMGDNRNNSRDSRAFGAIPKDLIEGRVLE